MKPDWKDAPAWAKWLAMDNNGDWHWYEDQPYPVSVGGFWGARDGYGRAIAGRSHDDWAEQLEPRP